MPRCPHCNGRSVEYVVKSCADCKFQEVKPKEEPIDRRSITLKFICNSQKSALQIVEIAKEMDIEVVSVRSLET